MLFMRWALVILKSFVIGALGTLLSLIALVTALVLYTALDIPPGTQIGWNVVSLLGPHWQVILTTIPAASSALVSVWSSDASPGGCRQGLLVGNEDGVL